MNITSTPWILVSLLASSSVFAACNEDAVKPSEASRFVLNAGEAYDQQTKLTWSRCSAGTRWTEGGGCPLSSNSTVSWSRNAPIPRLTPRCFPA